MRSFILITALALSVSAFPAPTAREVSVVDALVARTPQFGPFKGRGGSDDDEEDEVPAWTGTIPKTSPKLAPKPAGPTPPKNVAPKPKGSAPPRQSVPPKFSPDSDEDEEEEPEFAPKFGAGPKNLPKPKAQGSGPAPSRPLPPKGDRPFPKGAPAGLPKTFSPPKSQQPKPKSVGTTPPKESPFPDSEED
jgi:hypothetical protein